MFIVQHNRGPPAYTGKCRGSWTPRFSTCRECHRLPLSILPQKKVAENPRPNFSKISSSYDNVTNPAQPIFPIHNYCPKMRLRDGKKTAEKAQEAQTPATISNGNGKASTPKPTPKSTIAKRDQSAPVSAKRTPSTSTRKRKADPVPEPEDPEVDDDDDDENDESEDEMAQLEGAFSAGEDDDSDSEDSQKDESDDELENEQNGLEKDDDEALHSDDIPSDDDESSHKIAPLKPGQIPGLDPDDIDDGNEDLRNYRVETDARGNERYVYDEIDPVYDSDDTDANEPVNTVGDIDINKFYDSYPHIGYDINGKKIMRPAAGDALDALLDSIEVPKGWTGLTDPATGKPLNLSRDELELIKKIQKNELQDGFDPYPVCVVFLSLANVCPLTKPRKWSSGSPAMKKSCP